jgi:PTH1 family peptidyl-tRNA hydrolase
VTGSTETGSAEPWLVVGLGNPGPAYAGNRHNVGAMVVRELARRHDGAAPTFKAHRSRAVVDEVRLGSVGGRPGPRTVLAVPTTYMNESGGPVVGLLKYYGVPVEHLVVVHDELDLPASVVRVKRGGGEGGHNGLRSVSASMATKDYLRVRVGIGRPPGRMDPADFVLRDFNAAERRELPLTIDTAADAVESLVEMGLLDTQQRFHAP